MRGILLDAGKVSVTIVANTVIASKTVTPETLKRNKIDGKFNLKNCLCIIHCFCIVSLVTFLCSVNTEKKGKIL